MVIWAARDGHFNKSESDGEAIQLICLKAMRSFSARRTTGYAINSWRERVDSVAGSDV
jgi:hypothetical protein